MKKNLLIFFFREIFVRCLMTLLDDNLVYLQFDSLPLDYLLLYSVFADKSVNKNSLFLTDSVRSVHCLQINLWIPIRIIQDNVIR